MEVGQGNGQQDVNSTAAPGNRDAPGNLFANSPTVGQPTEVFADTLSVHSVPEPPVANVVDVLGQSSLKEADKMEILNLIDAAQFRTWKAAVREAVASASKGPQLAFQWIRMVEAPNITVEKFIDSDGFPTLDSKLASALRGSRRAC